MECNYCQRTYKTKCGLIIHQTSHTGEKVYRCDLCPKICYQPKIFTNHYFGNHGIFHCKTCNKILKKKSNLKQHQKVYAPQRDFFLCEYCGKTYLQKQQLGQHILQHNNKKLIHINNMKEYKREVCLAVFPKYSLLIVHANEHHIHIKKCPTTLKHKCTYCGKVYVTMYGPIIYETSHTGEKVYKCDLCPKIYSYPTLFENHYRYKHINNGNFNCKTCNKFFNNKYNLNYHQKIHAPQREKLICEYCGKTYMSKQGSSLHILCAINN